MTSGVNPGQNIVSVLDATPSNPGALEFQIGPMSSAVLVSSGTVTLNGATPVSVVNALVTANSIIIFTLKTAAGTQGAYPVATPSAGVGFNVKGTALDTGVYNWTVIG